MPEGRSSGISLNWGYKRIHTTSMPRQARQESWATSRITWGDSRLEDMLSDDSPYCDYSDMEDGLYDYLKKMVDGDEQI